jgi:hypothetical protein
MLRMRLSLDCGCVTAGGVLMTTVASAAIVIRIRAVNLYKFLLNFSKFS